MYQVLEQTHEEKVKMYSKISKKDLISMLIEANRHLTLRKPEVVFPSNQGLTVGDLCGCNPRNGGSGICGCTIANNPVDYNHYKYGYLTDIKL